jgi:hypothetical protein
MNHLRQSNATLHNGSYETLTNGNDRILSFLRRQKRSVCIIVNLSDKEQSVTVDLSKNEVKTVKQLWGKEKATMARTNLLISVPPYGIEVFELN